jgi:hypothetical protein
LVVVVAVIQTVLIPFFPLLRQRAAAKAANIRQAVIRAAMAVRVAALELLAPVLRQRILAMAIHPQLVRRKVITAARHTTLRELEQPQAAVVERPLLEVTQQIRPLISVALVALALRQPFLAHP